MRWFSGNAEYPQLRMALQRQLVWTREFIAVGDEPAAQDALLDANAISAELCEPVRT
ncbi:MAG: hypothetical protein QOI62_418 [Solirubrobacteraceae bacterium]|jgi:hypothetical protein|nr:hypothetical protein [Solirubrobacteraceae bacterium]MEA2277538.1 hypothetical protein [Solirubrobacteraceae bacterium]MEA2357158.1 hypothetical protein [Solirubrobacteraceae bacterium]